MIEFIITNATSSFMSFIGTMITLCVMTSIAVALVRAFKGTDVPHKQRPASSIEDAVKELLASGKLDGEIQRVIQRNEKRRGRLS